MLARGSVDPAMVTKVRAYAEARLPADLRRDADTTIARINDRIGVRKNRLPEIDAWLATSVNKPHQ